MSIGVTLDPTKAEQSRKAAEHVAAFLASGGKIQQPTSGAQVLPASIDRRTQGDQSWRAKIDCEAKAK